MLPSKKIRRVLYLIALVCGCWFLWTYFSGLQKTPTPSTVVSENQNSTNIQDTDNDGLLDWQETLYGTNTNIVDTDGDGVSDGQEVGRNQDPTKYGSGALAEVTLPDEQFEEPTLQIIQKNKDSESIQDLDERPAEIKKGQEYIPTLNSFADVIKQYPVLKDNDPYAFVALFNPKDSIEDDRERYLEVITNYQRVSDAIRQIDAHKALSVEQVKLANGYQQVSIKLKELVDIHGTDDEKKFSDAVVAYSATVVELQKYLYSVTSFILTKEVELSPSDSAMLFLFGG